MDEFANLSKYCPMTPLLWMQYAKDTEALMYGLYLMDSPGKGEDNDLHQLQQIQAKKEALESSTGILELGLGEFPGCSLLHLYYLESLAEYFYQTENEALHHLVQSESEGGGTTDSQDARKKLSQAFQTAWEYIGRGSHVNEGIVVSEIYRLHGSFLLACLSCEISEMSKGKQHDMDVDRDNICSIIQQLSCLCSRWSKTPMGEGSNDEMMEDFNTLWDEALSILGKSKDEKHVQLLNQQKSSLLEVVDDNRRSASSLTNVLSSYENDIDVAMTNEGIFFPKSFLQQRQDYAKTDATAIGKYLLMTKRLDSRWDSILLSKNRWLLGLGASETSHAFAKYASFLQRSYKSISQKGPADTATPLHDHMITDGSFMITSIYERAVSECPTVESLWTSYIKVFRGEWIKIRDEKQHSTEELQRLSNLLQSISQRSIRNCPYSSGLFELRMTTLALINTSNMEPDDITAVIEEATELGFLNGNRDAMLSMRLVAINVVKRKLASLVSRGTTSVQLDQDRDGSTTSRDYDQEDEVDISTSSRKKSKANIVQYNALAPTTMEEVQDLIEDIRDMYEETDNYLFKTHSKWDEGKVRFWKHRCVTEGYLLGPLAAALRNAMGTDSVTNELADAETMKCFEKLVKTQKPCHPNSWREYVRYVRTSRLHFLSNESSPSSPGEIGAALAELRQTRGLYKRAMLSTRKASKATPTAESFGVGINDASLQRDYDLALSALCHEYLEFEQNFGSEESLAVAIASVNSKMANFNDSALPVEAEENGKRKLTDEPSSATDDDQMQVEDDVIEGSRAKRTKVKTNLKEPKKTDSVHKVRIGKIDYPAHPFTIHISNLNKNTQDMDLVDAFRSIGGIVHAKILREKLYGKGGHHSHGESKGCGLVQFEERMNVEMALEQNGKLDIGGKVVNINRSHLPAVGIVPQGMHRVNPKGKGKVSKRNELKKRAIDKGTGDENKKSDDGVTTRMEDVASDDKPSKSKNKYRTSSSPGSIKLDSLSFKPRAIKQKPKISLEEPAKM